VPKLRIILGEVLLRVENLSLPETYVFPIIPLKSQRPLQVGLPGRCPAGPPVRPALYSAPWRARCNLIVSTLVVYTVTTLLQRFKCYYPHQIPLKQRHAEDEMLGFPVPCSSL
jgi:hypothetical protein